MKNGPPRSPKLREQIVSATHNVAPNRHTLHAGVIFIITITILPCPSLKIAPPQGPLLRLRPDYTVDKTQVRDANIASVESVTQLKMAMPAYLIGLAMDYPFIVKFIFGVGLLSKRKLGEWAITIER